MGKKKEIVLRTVIDTNIFISAVLFSGVASKIVEYWQRGDFVYLLSKPILEEYIKVLSYNKFKLTEKEIKNIVKNALLPFVELVECKTKIDIIQEDPQDNIFIAASLDGNASFIVSGDYHLIKLRQYKHIKIISLADFLIRLE